MSSPIDANKLLEWASERWEKRTTVLVVIFSIALILLWKFSGTELSDLSLWEILFIVFVCIIVYGFWLVTNRLPKCSRNNIGIAIAIAADSKEEYHVIASDFLDTLRRLLHRGNTTPKFCLVEIPQHYAKKIYTVEDAVRLRQRCRCHFMIWGTAKMRSIRGKQKHVMNLEGLVSHAAMPQHLHKTFSNEFAELFPRSIHVDRENDVVSLEFTSEWVDCVARYIIGIAAAFSGDVIYAQGLFETVLENPKLRDCPLPAIRKIRQRTPVRLGEIHAFLARIAYQKWRKNEDDALLEEIREHNAALARLDPANYSGRLLRAIYYFVADRNIDAAEAELKKCRDVRDGTWRYSYAFLEAYKGKLQRARRLYKSAFTHSCPDAVPCETEEFIIRVLEKEPERAQLHFCLGLINWHAKQDKKQAVRDFEAFLAAPQSSLFPEEQELAKSYVATLGGEIRKEETQTTVNPF